jgi:trehalose/maltose hydrolase-like predicted phosphorylase
LNSKHLQPLSEGGEENISYLEVRTSQSKIHVAEAAKFYVSMDGKLVSPQIQHKARPGEVISSFQIEVPQGSSLRVEKLISLFTSHPWDSENPLGDAQAILKDMSSFEEIYETSKQAWGEIWDQVDIQIEGDRLAQKLLRLHLYHNFVTASPHNEHIDAGIPARGLHGESYRGHIFWDELFILPLFNLHYPQISKSALMYRYRRLDQARDYAKEYGYEGAMYPWQSGSTGREETQVIHLNPLSGEWGPDNSSLQRHVSLAIAYNIWGYYWATLDTIFLEDFGAEMFLEICRFWASAAVFNHESGRYDIPKVMGPDEFHEKYPDKDEGGLTNNAYTNLMVIWAFERVFDIIDSLRDDSRIQLFKQIRLSEDELEKWRDIQMKLTVPISDQGILEQFEGFFKLKELDWDFYRIQYEDIHRMDRLLKKEGKSPDDYQVLKQADALMIFYNLRMDEIKQLLFSAGYDWREANLEKNFNYYIRRTSHGSTLSRITHAYLSYLIGEKKSGWEHFYQALISDYKDIQGGTTGEGIHTGVMAGTVYNTLRNFGGLSINKKHIHLAPSFPSHWRRLQFGVSFRGNKYAFDLTQRRGKAKLIEGEEKTHFYYDGDKIRVSRNKWTNIPQE